MLASFFLFSSFQNNSIEMVTGHHDQPPFFILNKYYL